MVKQYHVIKDKSKAYQGSYCAIRHSRDIVLDGFEDGNLDNYNQKSDAMTKKEDEELESSPLKPEPCVNKNENVEPGWKYLGYVYPNTVYDQHYGGLLFNVKDLSNFHAGIINQKAGELQLLKVANGNVSKVNSTAWSGDPKKYHKMSIVWSSGSVVKVNADDGSGTHNFQSNIEPITAGSGPAISFGFALSPGSRVDELEKKYLE